MNNEIVEKVKAQGIRVNLAPHKSNVSSALNTGQTKKVSEHLPPCTQCDGCLVSVCGECQLCLTSSKKYCIKQKCTTINSSQRLINNTSSDESYLVEQTELNDQPQVGIHGDLIVNINDEIEPFTDGILPAANNEVVIMETKQVSGKDLSLEDKVNGELSSRLETGGIVKNVNVTKSQKNDVEIKLTSTETSNANKIPHTTEAARVVGGPRMQDVRSNNIYTSSTVIFKSQDLKRSDKSQQVIEGITKETLKYNSENEGDITRARIPVQELESNPNNEKNETEIIDVTVEKLDNALLNELSQTAECTDRLSMTHSSEGNEPLPIPQKPVKDFRSKVRTAEMEIHEKVARTARVSLTSSNLDLSMAKNMLSHLRSNQGYFYVPTIKTEYVQKVLLSYFYFVRLKDEESRHQLQGKLEEFSTILVLGRGMT